MLKNYFIIALRNLKKQKVYSIINILGLTLGITSSLFMFLYVQDELSYDQHFENAERVYRITTHGKFTDSEINAAMTPPALGAALKAHDPGVERVAAFSKITAQTLEVDGKKYPQASVYLATEDLFNVLSFQLLEGDPLTVLSQPNSITLSQSLAQQLFGDTSALNQTIKTPWGDCQVTGVFQDTPENMHFHPNLFISVQTIKGYQQYEQIWDTNNFYTYVLLKASYDPGQLKKTLTQIYDQYMAEIYKQQNASVSFDIQKLVDIHLRSHLDFELEANSNVAYVYIFSALAAFMLLIACINYMNLATARATQRAKEVGVRKALGSDQWQLMWQFLIESCLLALVTVMLSIILFYVLLPWFNRFTEKSFLWSELLDPITLLGLLLMAIGIGLLSGSYPAFFLSGFNPVKVLKGNIRIIGSWHISVRKILVVVQFTLAAFMLISTLIVYQQFHYMQSTNLGFNQEQIIRIKLNRGESLQQMPALIKEMSQLASVKSIGTANQSPGDEVKRDYFAFETDQGETTQLTQWMTVDHQFIPTLNIPLLSGRNLYDQSHYQKKDQADNTPDPEELDSNIDAPRGYGREIIVNESLVKQMGWTMENAIGKTVRILPLDENWKATVVGVARDFHFSSLHSEIQPLMMINLVPANELMLVSIKSNNTEQALHQLRESYQRIIGNANMNYSFLDTHFEQQYIADQKRRQIFILFSALTIFIASLGLFGLASYTVTQRIKEIGIRKVMGASVSSILLLLFEDYIKLITIALIVAIPIANYFITEWLNNFAYKTEIKWWFFALPILGLMFIALLSVSQRAFQAAAHNPVDSLRYE